MAIIEAISSFRAGGYEEAIGFTVYDTLRYREALEPLVEEEVRVLLDRLAGKVEVERAVEIIASGAEPLRELIGAMHSKLLLAALRRDSPPRVVSFHHAVALGQLHPAWELAGECAERLAVDASHEQQVARCARAPPRRGSGADRRAQIL